MFGSLLIEDVLLTLHFPANIYLFKVNNKNTIKRCEIWSKLTIKTPEWQTYSANHLTVWFKTDVVLVYLLILWTYFTSFSDVSIFDFEKVCWVISIGLVCTCDLSNYEHCEIRKEKMFAVEFTVNFLTHKCRHLSFEPIFLINFHLGLSSQ